MTDESDFVFTNSSEDEDDILYSYPQNGELYEPSSLLFIHQSFEQMQILKRYTISLYNILKHHRGIIHAQITIL